ncbi:GtrA family protein [Massilia sp. SYSU DXS3249]
MKNKFLRFLVVGGVATALHYSVMAVLHLGLALSPALSSAIGFSVSSLCNYFLNRRFTFGSNQSHLVGVPRFTITAACGLILNHLILSLAMALDVGVVLAQVSSTVGVIVWNYCIHGVWTFRMAKAAGPAQQ